MIKEKHWWNGQQEPWTFTLNFERPKNINIMILEYLPALLLLYHLLVS